MADALRRAPVNSMSVVQSVGPQAGMLTTGEIDSLVAGAPERYWPTPI
jgi:hypothetical protein